MDCKEVKKNLIGYIECKLNKDEKNSFIKHIDICNSCKQITENFSEHYNFSSLKAGNIEDPYFYTRLVQIIENKSNSYRVFIKINRVLQPLTISVLILAGTYLGNYLGNHYHSFQFSNTDEIRKNQINDYAKENYIILAENETLENFLISNK